MNQSSLLLLCSLAFATRLKLILKETKTRSYSTKRDMTQLVLLQATITIILCLPNVLSRPEPDLKLQSSSVGEKQQAREGKSWQGGIHRPGSLGLLTGVATPRWRASMARSSGGEKSHRQKGENRFPGSHPAILLNQLSPAKQVLFLEKFSLLNPIQQAFAYNQFFSTAPDVQTFAINQFIELDSDLLIRSIQTELERVAEAFPKELEIVLARSRPELKFNSALVVKLPIGSVCHDQQWIDGRGVRTLYRDCESGFVYNINTNVHVNIDAITTSRPDVKDPVTPEDPSGDETTENPDTTTLIPENPSTGIQPDDDGSGDGTDETTEDTGLPETMTEIPDTTTLNPENPSTGIPPVDPPDDDICENVRPTTESGDCPADWFRCNSGDTCVPQCRR